MRNIFLENSYTKYEEGTSPRLFYEKSKLRISLDQQSEMLYILFLVYVHGEVYENILKLNYLLLAFNLYKAFLRNMEEV